MRTTGHQRLFLSKLSNFFIWSWFDYLSAPSPILNPWLKLRLWPLVAAIQPSQSALLDNFGLLPLGSQQFSCFSSSPGVFVLQCDASGFLFVRGKVFPVLNFTTLRLSHLSLHPPN